MSINNVKVERDLIDENWVIADLVINKEEKKIGNFPNYLSHIILPL